MAWGRPGGQCGQVGSQRPPRDGFEGFQRNKKARDAGKARASKASHDFFTCLIIKDMKPISFSMIPIPPDIVFDGGSDFDGPEA